MCRLLLVIVIFSGVRGGHWEPYTCGDLLDGDFVRMLTPATHFIGAKDAFSGPCHTGGSVLSAFGRVKMGISYMNCNIRVMIEVGFTILIEMSLNIRMRKNTFLKQVLKDMISECKVFQSRRWWFAKTFLTWRRDHQCASTGNGGQPCSNRWF